MPILKLYDESTQSWIGITTIQGEQGPQGIQGIQGPKGDPGTEFYYGITEPTDPDYKFWINPAGMNVIHEVPPYGAPGQILAKTSSDSYLIDWIDIPTISTSDIDTIMEG